MTESFIWFAAGMLLRISARTEKLCAAVEAENTKLPDRATSLSVTCKSLLGTACYVLAVLVYFWG